MEYPAELEHSGKALYVTIWGNQLCITYLNTINTDCILKLGMNSAFFLGRAETPTQQGFYHAFLFSCRPVFPLAGILSWLGRLWIRSQEAWPEAWLLC